MPCHWGWWWVLKARPVENHGSKLVWFDVCCVCLTFESANDRQHGMAATMRYMKCDNGKLEMLTQPHTLFEANDTHWFGSSGPLPVFFYLSSSSANQWAFGQTWCWCNADWLCDNLNYILNSHLTYWDITPSLLCTLGLVTSPVSRHPHNMLCNVFPPTTSLEHSDVRFYQKSNLRLCQPFVKAAVPRHSRTSRPSA